MSFREFSLILQQTLYHYLFCVPRTSSYKAGYYSAPEVHHVYLSPPVKYVEYVEKPIYIERIAPKPIYGPPHKEYAPAWSQPDPSPSYG